MKEYVEIVSENGLELENLPDFCKSNKEVVMAAVSQNGLALKFAADDLKADLEIVKTALSNYQWDIGDLDEIIFDFIDSKLQNNREIILLAVSNQGRALESISHELWDDFEIVLAAVGKYGMMLEFVSERLRDNFEVVFAAVNSHAQALEFASERLRDNYEIAMAAVSDVILGDQAYYCLSDVLKNDKKLLLVALESDYGPYYDTSDELRSDPEIINSALRYHDIDINYIISKNKSFRTDLNFIKYAIVYGHINFSVTSENSNLSDFKSKLSFKDFVDESVRNDKQKILELLGQTKESRILLHLEDELRYDLNIVEKAISYSSKALSYTNEYLQSDKDMFLKAATKKVDRLSHYLQLYVDTQGKLYQYHYYDDGVVFEYIKTPANIDKSELVRLLSAYNTVFNIAVEQKDIQLQSANDGFDYYMHERSAEEGLIEGPKDIIRIIFKDLGKILQHLPENFYGDEDIALQTFKPFLNQAVFDEFGDLYYNELIKKINQFGIETSKLDYLINCCQTNNKCEEPKIIGQTNNTYPVFNIANYPKDVLREICDTIFGEGHLEIRSVIGGFEECVLPYIHLAWLFANDLMIADGCTAYPKEGAGDNIDLDFFEDDEGLNLLDTYHEYKLDKVAHLLKI